MRDARSYVIQAVARQVRRWPDLNPHGMGGIESALADVRDRRAARALYQETVRRWLTLECLLNARLKRGLREMEPGMQAVLLVGACQVFFMDHLPDHAVVSEAVQWAKERIRPGAGKLVNAVLHRMIDLRGELPDSLALAAPDTNTTGRTSEHGQPVIDLMMQSSGDPLVPRSDGSILRLTDPTVLPTDRLERLAAVCSCPDWLLHRWQSTGSSRREVAEHALHGLVHAPVIVRCDTSNGSGNDVRPHQLPGFGVWSGASGSLGTTLDSTGGTMWVQDPSSWKAVAEGTAGLEVEPGDLVVDLCAGTGTKTRQLAARFPGARVLAVEVQEERIDQLHLMAEAMEGGDRCEVRTADDLDGFEGQARVVLADVPCSNTGVLARRIEARYRIDETSLRSLVGLQRQILVNAIRLLAPGGTLVYSTCSLESEENGRQARHIGGLHRLEVARECQTRPHGLPGDCPTAYCDGAYYAVLR
ncbi:MAG: hypothetical protein D8M59_02870 [Planctomycetes bacterium]|nr:hypothetical protein [Planctomycetota bacterium]NOG52938.1 hypothetical protein [Planctomycetota bacterium]